MRRASHKAHSRLQQNRLCRLRARGGVVPGGVARSGERQTRRGHAVRPNAVAAGSGCGGALLAAGGPWRGGHSSKRLALETAVLLEPVVVIIDPRPNNPCLVSSICNAPPVLKPCCASIAFLASAFTASSSPRALRGHAWLPLAAQQSHRMRLHRAVLRSCRAPWLPSATPSCWTRPQQLVLRRHLWYHASSMRLKSGMWPTTTVCSGRSSCAAREYTYGAWRRRRGCSSTRRGATSRLLRY